jgi:hypothetical protein
VNRVIRDFVSSFVSRRIQSHVFSAVVSDPAKSIALPLHPDAVCEFPTSTYRGAAPLKQGLGQLASIRRTSRPSG